MFRHRRTALLTLTALGVTAGAAVLAAPAAHAAPACGRPPVQYSVDGGANWTNSGTMPALSGTVQVRLAGQPAAGCDYRVSLGSYETQGATWATSGRQTFLGWATTTLTREHYRDVLDLSGHLPRCFGELALYGVGEKYDGSDGDHPLPHYPDEPFSGMLIASWNGGTACPPEPTGSPTSQAPVTPTAPATGTPTTTPAPTPAPTTAGATTAGPVPAPAAASTSSPAGPGSTQPGPSRASAASATAVPALAATGADDGLLTATAVGATVLVAAGCTAVYAGRRRAARR
ncbi:hypothetical protein ACFVHB_36205 [Kitasatospora sp. NPDC127111]|uniref:hypothetical protein n=1 Tax=Kitasatospora sp. NPDC127111 TaxID=3345363 RepID=UPI0036439D82